MCNLRFYVIEKGISTLFGIMSILALLSPAKTLDEGTYTPVGTPTLPALLKESEALVALLRKKSPAQLGKLMDISAKLAALNTQRFNDFTTPFTRKNAKQAIYMFRGDVYTGLDVDSLSSKEVERLNQQVAILSGLYGLLKPLDLMQPYRLEMGTPLKNPRGKDLYHFWGERITQEINARKPSLIVNLASQEYFAAVKPAALNAPLVHIHFKERKGNKLQVIGLFAKKARGMMARYIAQESITKAKDLQGFTAGGYQFEADLSGEQDYIFIR